VLLPVYAGTPPDQLDLALCSISTQTLAPAEVVVVEDGPLSDDHRRVLDRWTQVLSLKPVRITRPRGLGHALQLGLEACTQPWVARADADDICLSHRLALQRQIVADDSADVVGSAMLEADETLRYAIGLRAVHPRHAEIQQRMARGNPMNHPTVLMRRGAAMSSGGYRNTVLGAEDYLLWARLMVAGARFCNVSEPLVISRSGTEHIRRRLGRRALIEEVKLQRQLHRCGLIGRPRSWMNMFTRGLFHLLPVPLANLAYRRLLISPWGSLERSAG